MHHWLYVCDSKRLRDFTLSRVEHDLEHNPAGRLARARPNANLEATEGSCEKRQNNDLDPIGLVGRSTLSN